jgi:hypothetical protein
MTDALMLEGGAAASSMSVGSSASVLDVESSVSGVSMSVSWCGVEYVAVISIGSTRARDDGVRALSGGASSRVDRGAHECAFAIGRALSTGVPPPVWLRKDGEAKLRAEPREGELVREEVRLPRREVDGNIGGFAANSVTKPNKFEQV